MMVVSVEIDLLFGGFLDDRGCFRCEVIGLERVEIVKGICDGCIFEEFPLVVIIETKWLFEAISSFGLVVMLCAVALLVPHNLHFKFKFDFNNK